MKSAVYTIIYILLLSLIIYGFTIDSVEDSEGEHSVRSPRNSRQKFSGGSGTVANPFQISNVTELQWIGNHSNLDKHYVLINDIDATNTRFWNGGKGFEPIAKDASLSLIYHGSEFKGSLNGQGYSINGLYINRPEMNYNGLFGMLGQDCLVTDLNLNNTYVSGYWQTGLLAGENSGAPISDITVSGDTYGYYCVGSLIGRNNGGNVIRSHAMGDVKGYRQVGGLIGENINANLSSSTSRCRVQGDSDIGGLIGNHKNGEVSYCDSECKVFGNSSVGGLVGCVSDGIIHNVSTTSYVQAYEYWAGGLIGDLDNFDNNSILKDSWADCIVIGNYSTGGLIGSAYGKIDGVNASGSVIGIENVGGLIGWNHGVVINSYSDSVIQGNYGVGGLFGISDGDGGFLSGQYVDCVNSFYNVDDVMINGGSCITKGGLYNAQYIDWISHGKQLEIKDYTSTLHYNNGYYTVSSVQGMRDLLGFIYNPEISFQLITDIDLASDIDYHIPVLRSEFDGGGHTISNLWLNQSGNRNIGLFGTVSSTGLLRDLNLENIAVHGYQNVGGLVGYLNTNLTNCSSSGTVSGNISIGGLVGGINSRYEYPNVNAIVDSISVCDVSGDRNIGGLAGFSFFGDVIRSSSFGTVRGDEDVGGLVGDATGEIISSINSAKVVGGDFVGGIAGYGWICNVKECYSVTSVVGCEQVGGIMGRAFATTINTSFSLGPTYGNKIVGGVCGNASWCSITNVYSMSNVSGQSAVGGLSGWVSEDAEIRCSYSKGIVGGNQDVGGLIGYSEEGASIMNCFWDNETSGISESAGGVGSNTSNMMSLEHFLSNTWDISHINSSITTIWKIDDGYDYPRLDWMMIPIDSNPIADAGSDELVNMGTVHRFDGSHSFSYDGISSYSWSFIDRNNIELSGVSPTYVFNEPGVYLVTLRIVDNNNRDAIDTITLTVRDIEPPIAIAGPDIEVYKDELVTFDGSASYDNVGITSYTWCIYDATPFAFDTVIGTYTFTTFGEYVVTLKVADATGNWSIDELIVRVGDFEPPVANAGLDVIIDEDNYVEFDGTNSTDNIGIVNYTWYYSLGNEIAILYGINPSLIFEEPGLYEVVLNVTDAVGFWNTDAIMIKVQDITPPIAHAGADRHIGPGTIVRFDGSKSIDNYGIQYYSWTIDMDSGVITLDGISPEFNFTSNGRYSITLTVSDYDGNSDTDSLVVYVKEDNDDITPLICVLIPLFILFILILLVTVLLIRGRLKSIPQQKKRILNTDTELKDDDTNLSEDSMNLDQLSTDLDPHGSEMTEDESRFDDDIVMDDDLDMDYQDEDDMDLGSGENETDVVEKDDERNKEKMDDEASEIEDLIDDDFLT